MAPCELSPSVTANALTLTLNTAGPRRAEGDRRLVLSAARLRAGCQPFRHAGMARPRAGNPHGVRLRDRSVFHRLTREPSRGSGAWLGTDTGYPDSRPRRRPSAAPRPRYFAFFLDGFAAAAASSLAVCGGAFFAAAFFAGAFFAGAFFAAGGTASASAVRSTTESSPPKSLGW